MSKQPNPATVLANLLSGLSTGAVKVVELNIDPSLSAEEQINTIADQMAAQHRETCSACRDRYEREQVVQAKKDAEADKVKHPAERKTSTNSAFEASYGADGGGGGSYGFFNGDGVGSTVGSFFGDEGKPKATYHEVGFMAYQNGVPIPTSFDADRSVVEAKLKLFSTDPIVKLLGTLTGTDPTKITIRPVYDER